MKKDINLHLISDSTGEVLEAISKAILTKFPTVKVNKNAWFLTKTISQLESTLKRIKNESGIILYTLNDPDFASVLKEWSALNKNVVCVSALNNIIRVFSEYLNIPFKDIYLKSTDSLDVEDAEYLKRIEAINYTIAHDDGNLSEIEDLEKADIVIIGTSRTSKSPVSVYLSHKGYKVANIPFVSEDLMPDLKLLKKPKIVGFTIDPFRLEEIRRTRMKLLTNQADNNYSNLDNIKAELLSARKYFNKLKCPVIDVTNKSVEETVVYVIQALEYN